MGIPSSGIHSNGLTLARSALPDLDERPPELGGASVGETLLEPTVIYVRAVRELLASAVDVRGLAHITGEGFLNLLRLEAEVGYRLDSLPEPPPVFGLIAERGRGGSGGALRGVQHGRGLLLRGAGRASAPEAVELLSRRHPGATVIGHTTADAGVVELPEQGLVGRATAAS